MLEILLVNGTEATGEISICNCSLLLYTYYRWTKTVYICLPGRQEHIYGSCLFEQWIYVVFGERCKTALTVYNGLEHVV